jgi:hypothetical protein
LLQTGNPYGVVIFRWIIIATNRQPLAGLGYFAGSSLLQTDNPYGVVEVLKIYIEPTTNGVVKIKTPEGFSVYRNPMSINHL